MYVVVRRYVSISRESNVNIKDVGIVLSTLLPRRDMLHTSLSCPGRVRLARCFFLSQMTQKAQILGWRDES
jgi:hypothetical protein